jgi:hypothetical protein
LVLLCRVTNALLEVISRLDIHGCKLLLALSQRKTGKRKWKTLYYCEGWLYNLATCTCVLSWKHIKVSLLTPCLLGIPAISYDPSSTKSSTYTNVYVYYIRKIIIMIVALHFQAEAHFYLLTCRQ